MKNINKLEYTTLKYVEKIHNYCDNIKLKSLLLSYISEVMFRKTWDDFKHKPFGHDIEIETLIKFIEF